MSYELERENSDNINKEPTFEISARYFSFITHQSFNLVVVSREEREDNISQEDKINEDLNTYPLNIFSIEEAHFQWGDNRRQ